METPLLTSLPYVALRGRKSHCIQSLPDVEIQNCAFSSKSPMLIKPVVGSRATVGMSTVASPLAAMRMMEMDVPAEFWATAYKKFSGALYPMPLMRRPSPRTLVRITDWAPVVMLTEDKVGLPVLP